MYRGYGTYNSFYRRRRQRGTIALRLVLVTLGLVAVAGIFSARHFVNAEQKQQEVVDKSAQQAVAIPAVKDIDQTIELKDVSGGKSIALATRKITATGSTLLVVASLPAVKTGEFYEVWAVQPQPYTFMSLGKMVKRADGKFGLVFEATEDVSKYTSIIVTLEKDQDPAPGSHMMEGGF